MRILRITVKNKKNFILICFFAYLLIGGLLMIHSALAAEVQFSPQISFPGFMNVGVSKNISGTTLAEFIIAFYKWSIGIIAFLAVIMIMIAGFRWMTAAGSAPQITQAKDQINSALIGLILAIGAYSLLSFLNPALVRFKSLEIENVSITPLGTAIKVHVCDANSPVFVSKTAKDGKWRSVPECGQEIGWEGIDGKPHKCMGIETDIFHVCNIVFGITDEHKQRIFNGENTSENTYDSYKVYTPKQDSDTIHTTATTTVNLALNNLGAPFECGSTATSLARKLSYGSSCGYAMLCSYFAYSDANIVDGQCNRGTAIGWKHCDIGDTRALCTNDVCKDDPMCTDNDAVKETDKICCQVKNGTGYYLKQ
ncbi:MAG: pilin [Patescibacteria group bacterium]